MVRWCKGKRAVYQLTRRGEVTTLALARWLFYKFSLRRWAFLAFPHSITILGEGLVDDSSLNCSLLVTCSARRARI